MPEKADISRTLLLPFMSIILLVAVYMTPLFPYFLLSALD